MVIDKTINKILRRLEIYFLRKNEFQLTGKSYDLIMAIPSETSYSYPKYSWIIGAKIFDNKPQKEVINEIINDLKETLPFEIFSSVSRINIINSNQSIVKNLKFALPYQKDVIELNEFAIGGVRIDEAYLIRSKLLEKVKTGAAVVFITNKGLEIAAGIISMNDKFIIKHYTGKGLRYIFKAETDEEKKTAEQLKQKNEEYLIQNDYITFTKLKDIYTVK